MGSELIDRSTGTVLWGLRDPRWYVRAWAGGSSLRALQLTPDEREGRYDRIQATALLRFPAFAPVLQGAEPYTRLTEELRRIVAHPDAVTEFPYDWRLPVAHNGKLLAEAVHRHRAAWERHPARDRSADVRVVIVAHSMGGIVARHCVTVPGALEDLRSVITLGTPFYGAVKAVVLLSSGRGGPLPLPRARLRALAAGLPGVYDLLPTYRCVDLGSEARRLTTSDVAALGGDAELAGQAAGRQARVATTALPQHVQVVGAGQPTLQSVTLADGVAEGHAYTCRPADAGGLERVDLAGDSTVHRESAQLPDLAAMPLAQSHGAIAKSEEAILAVTDAVTRRRTGPWLGAADVGIAVPDVVRAGQPFVVAIQGVEGPRDVSCRLVDTSTGRLVAMPPIGRADGGVRATVVAPAPGLYRVEVTGGGASNVSQMVLADDGAGTGDRVD